MMKSKYLIRFVPIMLLTAMFLTTACNGSDNDAVLPGQQQPENMHDGHSLHVVTAKQPFADESGTRTNTDFDGTYATTFTNGDEIGVIAVKDGAVLDDCNNVKLTYNSGTNKWEGDDVFYKSGAIYIAYSPYRSVMNGKRSAQEIFDSFVVSSNQSTAELFAANDLMISASGTANQSAKTLSFAFEHKLAMLELSMMYGRTTDNWRYPIKSSVPSTCSINNTEIVSNFFLRGKTYRCLVKPASNASLKFLYKLNSSNDITWNASNQNFVGGQRRKILPFKTRNIEIGDYLYKDGSIYPSNESNPPVSSCIGVVYALGSTGIAAGDTDNFGDDTGRIHGYVAALSSSKPTAWSYHYVSLSQSNKSKYNGNSNNTFFTAAQLCPELEKPNIGSSKWYMPSYAQLRAMNNTKSVCEPNMKKVGGVGYTNSAAMDYQHGVWIWTNTSVAPSGNLWCIWFKGNKGTQGEERPFLMTVRGNNAHSCVAHFSLTF